MSKYQLQDTLEYKICQTGLFEMSIEASEQGWAEDFNKEHGILVIYVNHPVDGEIIRLEDAYTYEEFTDFDEAVYSLTEALLN